jgi:predicted RNA-binding Zn-ribbon protein involved in translation (DUF1610 family)
MSEVVRSADLRGTHEECPKCGSSVKAHAFVCPMCSFDLAGFRENLASAKCITITPMPINAKTKQQALSKIYSDRSGCMGWGMIGCSLVVWIVPLAGLVAAPVCFIVGVICLLAPSTGGKAVNRIFSPEKHEKNKLEALELLRNSYSAVTCPHCGRIERDVSWSEPGGWWHCPQCGKRLLRQGDTLYYIPKPDALPSGDYSTLFGCNSNGAPADATPQHLPTPSSPTLSRTPTAEDHGDGVLSVRASWDSAFQLVEQALADCSVKVKESSTEKGLLRGKARYGLNLFGMTVAASLTQTSQAVQINLNASFTDAIDTFGACERKTDEISQRIVELSQRLS